MFVRCLSLFPCVSYRGTEDFSFLFQNIKKEVQKIVQLVYNMEPNNPWNKINYNMELLAISSMSEVRSDQKVCFGVPKDI